MAKVMWLTGITLLTVASLLLSGCAGHPKGLDKPRYLTDDEKDTVVKIALGTPQGQKQLETASPYTTAVNWLAVIWDGPNWSAYYHVDSNWENDPNLNNVPASAVYYPYVIIRFMEPASWQIATAVDLNTGKVVLVHEYPANMGPEKPNSDSLEIEIRPAPIHEVQINIAESNPPQIIVYIKGRLSDGYTA